MKYYEGISLPIVMPSLAKHVSHVGIAVLTSETRSPDYIEAFTHDINQRTEVVHYICSQNGGRRCGKPSQYCPPSQETGTSEFDTEHRLFRRNQQRRQR